MPNGKITFISKEFQNELDKIDFGIEVDGLSRCITEMINVLIDANPSKTGVNADLLVSKNLLRVVLESYYIDTIKYCNFHPYEEREKSLNEFKRAAYICKWLIKIKPIFVKGVKTDSEGVSFPLLMLNELVAFHYSLTLVGGSILNLKENFINRVLYSLHYRDFSVSHYCFLLENLCYVDER